VWDTYRSGGEGEKDEMRAAMIRVGHHRGGRRRRASDHPSVFGWDDVVAMRMKAETTGNAEVDDNR